MTNLLSSSATAPQVSFIRDLLSKKELDATRRSFIEDRIATNTLTKAEASMAITILKAEKDVRKAPVFAPAPADDTRAKVLAVLETIPHGRYAIPTDEVAGALTHTDVQGNDLLFIRVSEYRKTLYMRRLHGAPGAFATSRVSIADALTIARVLADKPERYGKIFADHYTCCARCLAPLTDPLSRETGYGPTCRQAYGL